MFRHLCLLAVAFLAVSDAKNHTAKHIKDSKPCGDNGNKKTKTATFCVIVNTDFVARNGTAGGILSVTQGPLFDCNDNTPVEDDFFGVLSLSCAGIWDGNPAGEPDGDLQCSGIITVNTENDKRAKQDFSSVAFTALSPVDISISPPPGSFPIVDIGQATGLVITGSNGAWGKSDNIKDITFSNLTGDITFGTFQVEIEYKTRGFNPVPV